MEDKTKMMVDVVDAPPPSVESSDHSYTSSIHDIEDPTRDKEHYGESLFVVEPPYVQPRWTFRPYVIHDAVDDDDEDDEVEEAEAEEEVPEEEEEIFYASEDFISKPYLSSDCTLPENILEFDYSFGYDCQKYFNLCVVDQVVLIYASGNIIHFFDTSTNEKWYRRASGNGIGHIAKNPKESHIAVGEKSNNPLIIIYDWPSFEIVAILRGGTKFGYAFLNYSPDGELLCSQGDQPDYTLTIWNWRKYKIMLKAKAYGQNVFHARFSLYCPGHLTSSGINHIKFWKINRTFTGLKLQGDLGRFGKSEICNVIGFLALPDEKVVSGCEWGNILVWEGGLIRVEVFRRGKNYCHEAPITQLIYNNGEMTTVAMDGTIKVWYYETIELADPPEEDRIIEVEPIFEYEVGDYYHKAKLLVIVQADPNSTKDNIWFGQDGNGGIWRLNLSMSTTEKHATQIFHCHAGAVAGIQCSPFSDHLASLGIDGKLFIYDLEQNATILKKEYLAGGCSLLWLPLGVEISGSILIGGFLDGVVRVICVSLHEYIEKIPSPNDEYINLIQVIKPHTSAVTVVTINPKHTIIVTGSTDSTIFVFQIKEGEQFPKLIPIGYVPVTGEVTHCTWKPRKEATLLVSCSNGTFVEVDLPTEVINLDPVSYLLENVTPLKHKFRSIKMELIKAEKVQELKLENEEIMREKRRELEEKAEASGQPIDENILDELQMELDAKEPELPDMEDQKADNPILFAAYLGKTIWLSMGGFDAGYMYEYTFNSEYPVHYTMIPEARDIEISCHHFYHNNKYLILGMGNGRVRVVKVNTANYTDLTNFWELTMHDNDNGRIRQICFNKNYSKMFTCGNDGNVFSYIFNPENKEYRTFTLESTTKGFPEEIISDIDDAGALSLEQAKSRIEFEEKMKAANAFKRDLGEVLKGLEKKYETVLRKNNKLPKSQQLNPQELVIDERVNKDLQSYLEEEMYQVKIKTAWQFEKARLLNQKVEKYFIQPLETHAIRVHGILQKDIFVQTFRQKALGDLFKKLKVVTNNKLEEQEAKGRSQTTDIPEVEVVEIITRRPNPVEGLLKQIMTLCGDYKKNIKLRRLLRKYRARKDKLESRRIEWCEMMKKQPNPEKPDPEDVASIKLAMETIGDYQMKTAPDYIVTKDSKMTTVHVFSLLLQTRERIYNVKKEYNDRVLGLRKRKQDMIERHEFLRDLLLEIAKEIPKEKIRHPPNLPTYVDDIEFPEKKFIHSDSGIFDELPKRFKSAYKLETEKKKEIKQLDREYEMLLLEKRGQKMGKVLPRLSLMKFSGITGVQNIDELTEVGKDDQIPTPWEKECKKLRVIKRLYEQDGIIDEMDTGIRQFDEEIVELVELKYQTEVEVVFLELFLLTLNQEVLILKKFESAEEEKENKLYVKLQEKQEIQSKMNEINLKVETRHRNIRRSEEETKNLITLFHSATADNKFYDFLRRIFKKKYRPPKTKTEESDSDSESESSSSSEEEDAKSLDSKEIGSLRLDETVCPAGCDPALYEWTIEQRKARHVLELNIAEEKKQIELHKKEYETLTKKIKIVENQYLACKEDLEEYVREKQRNLNEVETVALLRLSQIQNFKNESEIEKISDSVVFSANTLTNLYKRVGELEKETLMERQKHEKNRQHLTRMKIDIKHMKEMIVNLTNKIDETMIRKFGTRVDVDDIEETLLKRLVAEMHSIVLDLGKEFEKKLKEDRNKLIEKENDYARKVQDNTERHNLLTVLQEEKIRILTALKRQDKIMCSEKNIKEEEITNVENLRKISCMQEGKIRDLRNEIAALKLKCRPKPTFGPPEEQETIQKIMIKPCEDDEEVLNVENANDLRDMYEEAQEVVQDISEGNPCEEDMNRMKKLTKDMINKLPQKCQNVILRKFSRGNITEIQRTNSCPKYDLREVAKNMKFETFLELMQTVKETLESSLTQFEVLYNEKQE